MRPSPALTVSILALALGFAACDDPGDGAESTERWSLGEPDASGESEFEAGVGVDLENETIHVGALNDESGPAAGFGAPFAVGKRVVFARAAEDDSRLLPKGWSIELHERDHASGSERAVEAFESMRDEVLFFASSVGGEPTLAVQERLEENGIVAFPASLSSRMAERVSTPTIGPTYRLQAVRAAMFARERNEGSDPTRIGLLYQEDPYGRDALEGVESVEESRDVELAAEQVVAAGQSDVSEELDALASSGARFVVLAVLPSTTAALLEEAAESDLDPTWIALSPAWSDQFFDDSAPPADAFEKFFRVDGLPYWGESVPGMEEFTRAHEAHGDARFRGNDRVLTSYVHGLLQLEVLRRCLDGERLTRETFLEVMHGVTYWTGGGMTQPLDLAGPPYRTATEVRVLRPNFPESSWEVAAPYAEPDAAERPSDDGSGEP